MSRLLLVETIVPAPGTSHFAKLSDLEMLVVVGAKERTVDEYSRLFERAGFRLIRVVPITEPASILEAAPE